MGCARVAVNYNNCNLSIDRIFYDDDDDYDDATAYGN